MSREWQVGDKIVTVPIPLAGVPHWLVMLQERADVMKLPYTPEQVTEVVDG